MKIIKRLINLFLILIFIINNTQGQEENKFNLNDSILTVGSVCILETVKFDIAKYNLRTDSYPELERLVEFLEKNDSIRVEIGGHDCNPIGNRSDSLCKRRAESVYDFLVEKGIDPNRLEVKGYANSVPYQVQKKDGEIYSFLKEGDILSDDFISKLENPEYKRIAWRLNLRVEIKILALSFF